MKHAIKLLTVSAMIAFALSVFAQSVTAEWECVEDTYLKPTTVIIRTWVYSDNVGKIEANGIVKESYYSQQGLDHRWDFDYNEFTDKYKSAFIIDPSGGGRYFYFGDKDTANSSIFTECTKTK